MPQDYSAVVFIAFGVLALCVMIALIVFVVDWFSPCWRFLLCVFKPIFRRIKALIRKDSRGGGSYGSDDSDDSYDSSGDDDFEDNRDFSSYSSDDVSADAAQVLAMLNTPTIVIDADNDVIRASSEAYTLGVVVDDSVAQQRVLEAVNAVRVSGGYERFTLVTATPERYITISEKSADKSDTISSANSSAKSKNNSLHPTTISRPNWLTVTVGSVGGGIVVVIIEDTSAAHRFAQTRDDFISNVSEQLISSTRTLTQLTKILQNDNVSAQKVSEVAKIAGKSSTKLEHMLEDLLWLVRAQNPIDVNSAKVLFVKDLISDVQNQVESFAESCGVRIMVKADDLLQVRGDAGQIRAAIRKLVENAVTYSPENSAVSVSATTSYDGNYAVIRVVDRGAGIAAEDQSRIFERFYRAHNQNDRSQDGVGLGLAIAKHVALTHHGNITLWSSLGQGTTVSFALPIANKFA